MDITENDTISLKGPDKLFKPHSISIRLALSLSIVVTTMLLVLTATMYINTNNDLNKRLEQDADELLDFMTGTLKIPLWDLNEQSVQSIGDTLFQNNLVASLVIKKRSGVTLYSSSRKKSEEICIQRSSDIVLNDERIGNIQLSLTKGSIHERLHDLIWDFVKIISLILISLLFLTKLLIRHYFKIPLDKLNNIVNGYAAGKYNPEAILLPYKEFQMFERVLIKMGNTIQEQMNSLRQSEEKYRVLFKSFPMGITITDPTGKILESNEIAKNLLGVPKTENEQRNIDANELTILRQDRTPMPPEEFPSVIALEKNTKIENVELGIVKSNDHITWLNVTAAPIPLNEYGVAVAYGDITNRKYAEDELIESESRFKTMIEKSPLPIVITDQNKNIVFLNDKFTELFGYTLKEVSTYKEWWKTAYPDKIYREKVKQSWEDAIEYAEKNKKDIAMQTWDLTIKDRTKRTCEFYMVPLGEVGLIIMNDISEKKKLENQLQQSQKMESIGTLAGGIAHDFNNLLYPIIGFAEMLKEDLPQDSPEHESAQEIFNAGRRGGELVKQILAFSRQTEHKLSPVRFQKILAEVCKLTRSTIPSNIEIHQNIQKDCGLVMAEATQLHQIAMNLITNAYHAVKKASGEISIHLKEIMLDDDDLKDSSLQPGQYVMLSVSDNGVGIPREIRNNIFEPYFTTKETGKGTGLGLAVVYGILKEHKGDIKVYSEEGKGTIFNVYIPLMKQSTKTVVNDPVSVLPTGTERILLVDDEESIVRLEKQMLERFGYKVVAQSSSIDALELFKANPDDYDLVISDMSMPNLTGDQLAQKLMSIRPDIPIVICTGFSERINKEQSEANKVKGFLMKPIVKSEMAQMVRKVLNEVQGKTQQ